MALQGQKVGAYRLHEIIGSGGFATVYRGTHESLGIDRAVKVLEDRYNVDQRVRELFVREGRRAATLDTPYVVRVQDAGETVPETEAGSPGGGPWAVYAGSSPFTGYSVASRPGGATQLCVLVANVNHSVNQGTGNCVALP